MKNNNTNTKPRNRKFNNNKKGFNKPRKTILKVKMFQDCEYFVNLFNIVNSIPFDKISIPMYCSRYNVEGGDANKYVTIGYIKGFDQDTDEFTFVVFDNYVSKVKEFIDTYGEDNVFIMMNHGVYEGEVTTITKIVLDKFVAESADEEVLEESVEEEEAPSYCVAEEVEE